MWKRIFKTKISSIFATFLPKKNHGASSNCVQVKIFILLKKTFEHFYNKFGSAKDFKINLSIETIYCANLKCKVFASRQQLVIGKILSFSKAKCIQAKRICNHTKDFYIRFVIKVVKRYFHHFSHLKAWLSPGYRVRKISTDDLILQYLANLLLWIFIETKSKPVKELQK